MNKYVLGIDQSTQGTKGLLFDEKGALVCRADLPHKQYIDERGWVEHDPEEIYANTLQVVKNLIEKAGINKKEISVLGIREKPLLSGTAKPENRYTMQLYGSVQEEVRSAKRSLQSMKMQKNWFVHIQGFSYLHIFQRQRSPGSSRMCREHRKRQTEANSAVERSTAGWSIS